MCGISAYIGEYPVNKDKFKLLMLYNESRGKDASGFYYYGDSPLSERIIKKKGEVSKEMLPLNNIPDTKLIIAHTRAGTSGTNTENNAHPFTDNGWVLVHNGKIENRYPLNEKYKFPYNSYDVDSEVLVKALALHNPIGTENDFKILQNFKGPATILFTKDDGRLYYYHNSERPLFRGTIDENNKKGLYFSSLKESLEAIGCTRIIDIKTDNLYSVTIDNLDTTAFRKIKKDITEYAHTTYPQNHINTRSPIIGQTTSSNVNNYDNHFGRMGEPFNRYPKSSTVNESKMWIGNIAYLTVLYDDGSEVKHREFFNDLLKPGNSEVITKTFRGKQIKVLRVMYNDGGYEDQLLKESVNKNRLSKPIGKEVLKTVIFPSRVLHLYDNGAARSTSRGNINQLTLTLMKELQDVADSLKITVGLFENGEQLSAVDTMNLTEQMETCEAKIQTLLKDTELWKKISESLTV